jgi:hypothetical protein
MKKIILLDLGLCFLSLGSQDLSVFVTSVRFLKIDALALVLVLVLVLSSAGSQRWCPCGLARRLCQHEFHSLHMCALAGTTGEARCLSVFPPPEDFSASFVDFLVLSSGIRSWSRVCALGPSPPATFPEQERAPVFSLRISVLGSDLFCSLPLARMKRMLVFALGL